MEDFKSGDEVILEIQCGRNMYRRRKGVVRRLPLVDMIVGVNCLHRARIVPEILAATVGNDLVDIHVCRGPGTCLKGIDGEVSGESSLVNFAGNFRNEGSVFIRNFSANRICPGCRLFNKAVGLDDAGVHRLAANLEVMNRPLGGSSIERTRWNADLSHAVCFNTSSLHF